MKNTLKIMLVSGVLLSLTGCWGSIKEKADGAKEMTKKTIEQVKKTKDSTVEKAQELVGSTKEVVIEANEVVEVLESNFLPEVVGE